VKRWGPAIAWAIVIFIGSSIPGHSLPKTGIWDKLEHATEYAIFAALLAWGFGIRRWWWAIIAGALYGVSDEFHQTFTPGRSGNDLGDMSADAVGAIVGATLFYVVRRRANKAA
jgi:VanZ family protein